MLKIAKFESETTYSWTNSKTKKFAEGNEVTIGGNGKMVKPGWKWIVKQLVGTAAFAEISTDKYKSIDVKCNTVKSQAVDRSTIQFLTIFGVLLTEMCYYNRRYRRATTVQFLKTFGVLLTETCY